MSTSDDNSVAHRGDEGVPPGLSLYQMAIGHFISHALFLATKLEIADLLAAGPRDAADLARTTQTHAPSLHRVMRLLTSVGVFKEQDDGKFALSSSGEQLRTDVPGSMHAMVTLFTGVGIQEGWRDLEYCVRTGEPAFRKNSPDADPFTAMALDPQQAAVFDKAMATFAPQTAAAVAAAYDFSAFNKVADIGGGNGSLLRGILKQYPNLHGVVFDQPHVAQRAQEEVKADGLDDRCEVARGSFFDQIPIGADAYMLKHVIHDWNDEQAAEILKNCRTVMPPHGKLLLVEGVYPARIDDSPKCRSATTTDVNMLVSTGGRQRSETEFKNLLADSGFRLARIIPTPARVCVIEGAPA